MDTSVPPAPRVLLLDAFGLIFRAYFAFAGKPLLNPQGQNVNALFGFYKTLFQLIREQKPTHLAVVYDSPGATFRHELYPEYKAQRDAAPEDLLSQLPEIERLLKLLGVPILIHSGVEADDLVATAALWCRERQVECFIVSNDKDLLAMVGGSVRALRSDHKGGWRVYGPDEVIADKGVRPEQIRDWLALVGDSSDNIPGVKGIGEKSACKLLEQFGDLDQIYARLGEVSSASWQAKLTEGRELAYLSRTLATLKTDVDCGFDLETARLALGEGRAVADAFLAHNAKALAAEVLNLTGEVARPVHEPGAAPPVLGPRPLTGDYETVTTLEALDRWVEALRQAGACALDVETDSLDTFAARLVGLSLSAEIGKAAYIPFTCAEVGSFEAPELLEVSVVLDRLRPLLEDPAFRVVGQNFKFDWKVLRRHGVDVPRFGFDTMLAAWLLDAGAPGYDLETLGLTHLGLQGLAFSDLVPKGKTFADVPLAQAGRYGAEDADLTWRLFKVLGPRIEAEGFGPLLYDLELPLARLLARMEVEGILLRGEELRAFGEELAGRIAFLEQEIHGLCGKTFNLGSPKQLQEVLFVDRQLVPPARAKIKTGWSTDSDILEELAEQDPVPAKILAWRTLSKLKSTYVETLPALTNPVTGRLHTQFVQTGTATGRLASKDPNLQNIPIREDDGRRIRQAFVPRPGWRFVSADYSQIELVVLAHLCGDPNLTAAFHEGLDVHRKTAALMFGVSAEAVTPDQRRAAKAINFGLMYGMSAFRLANELKIPRKDAQAFFDAYKREFAGVDTFFQTVIAEAERTGEVRTLLGHRRPLANITGRNRVEKQAAERIAMNTPIQGSAADIVKTAMLRVDRALTEAGFQARLLLQVHDELLLEAPEAEVEAVQALLRREMEAAVVLSVPLRVGIEAGDTWGALH